MSNASYYSIFTDATAQQRKDNFDDYWVFTQNHGGELLEADKDLAKKRARLEYFQNNRLINSLQAQIQNNSTD
jgi:hypothetical protein